MKQNVLKFKNDIKEQVDFQKGLIKDRKVTPKWMHPLYCAYYILKHNVEDVDNYIEEDIKRSYKALPCECLKGSFRRIVKNQLERYAEEIICTDKSEA